MNPIKNEYLIEGYSVQFPYDAYKCQINYMQKILYSLKYKKHALLESPTGTGKTLCLLASTLAFQKHFLISHGSLKKPIENTGSAGVIKSEGGSIELMGVPRTVLENNKDTKMDMLIPRIIYSSRTHTQLSQVMRELKSSGISDGFTIELFDTEAENKAKIEKSTSKKRPVIKGGKKLFKATILGSRDQLCVHPKISKFRGNALIKNCRKITKEGKCKYHNNLKQANNSGVAADIQDIEDLKNIASSSDSGYFCPFYATREIESVCNVVLLPYNYLLDSITRQNLKIDLNNTVLILDEAHNVESVSEEAYSFDLRDIDLALSQKAIQNVLEATKLGLLQEKESDEQDSDADISFDIEVAVALATGIHLLSRNLKEIPCPVPTNNNGSKFKSFPKMGEVQGTTYPGSHIYSLFASSGFGIDNFQAIDECLTNMINFGQNLVGPGGNVSGQLDVNSIQINARIGALERFQRCLRLTFNETVMKNPQWFKLYIHYEFDGYKEINGFDENGGQNSLVDPETPDQELSLYLSFWCFSAAAALSSLVSAGVRSMIITSGTLSPLDTLAQQFSSSNVTFDVFLENDHVIDSESQLWAATLERGNSANSTHLIGSYEARNNPSYFSSLGSVVFDCVKRIPDGILLFFGSYSLMDQAVKHWTDQGLIERIKAFKSVFIEPRNSFELGSVLESYMDCINKGADSSSNNDGYFKDKKARSSLSDFVLKSKKISSSGSLLIAVCRGKVSEGINFSDNACRGVIIAGLPFPSIADARVCLKKQYMDESKMDGRQWYNQQAIRAVNQAIGRVVRHRNDYGAIILADKRFNQPNIYTRLSKWIRTNTKHLPQLDSRQLDNISDFFEKKLSIGVNGTNCHSSEGNNNKEIITKTLPSNILGNKTTLCGRNPSVVSFPNLSNEINTLLKRVENKNTTEEESKGEENNTENKMIIPKPFPGLISKVSVAWKRVKTSSPCSDSQNSTPWTFSSNKNESSNHENQKRTNFNIIPLEKMNYEEILNNSKHILREDEFNRLKPYIQNLNQVNSNSLRSIVNILFPSYIIEEKNLTERNSLALELLKLLSSKYREEFRAMIEKMISNIDMMKDKALVDALESEL
ncbi:Helicase C-terminal domain protein [Cryptosporidium meleagridis]|uniref:Helicase C-terminal domain protein n=1 Tax=Cryptosporidium meleagridis TaxID=93969 RepID=A0A2P4Z3D4_9CRYT|nr:Helicase C-terminal domain protein [Cryptosporidium meleagridis]